jgi:hypothetical protein
MEQNLLGMQEEMLPDSPELLQDPQIAGMTGTEDASPEEEKQLLQATVKLRNWLYSEAGMAAVANVFNQDSRELFEIIPEVGKLALERVHGEMPNADPSIWFGENGLIQQTPPMLFEIAEQMGVPGTDNQDQLAAATMGLYKAVGEHILEMGDEEARKEAVRFGTETLMTGEDGEMSTPEKIGGKKEGPKMNKMSADIKGLLGV